MAQTAKTQISTTETQQDNAPATTREWRPFTSLRRAVDRLVEDFDRDFWRVPVRRPFAEVDFGSVATVPAADVVETDKDYKIALELPGMAEKDIDVKVTDHTLTVTGEKKEEREEKRKDYYLSERRYGSFRRSFEVPSGINSDAIAASFANGVLTVTLPKTAEAQKAEKRIDVKVG